MKDKLLPGPFCGGNTETEDSRGVDSGGNEYVNGGAVRIECVFHPRKKFCCKV